MVTVRNTFLMVLLLFSLATAFAEDQPPRVSHDGLVLVEDSKVDQAYVQPGADLSVYDKVMLAKPHIAFKKNWQRDQNRNRFGEWRVTDADMERIISRTKDHFGAVFFEVLEEHGYPVVSAAGADVLLVRPAIIDLDVTAPDVGAVPRSETYAARGADATLFMEMYDSVTGQILVRAVDKKQGRHNDLAWSIMRNESGNMAEARKAFRFWAELLADALDEARKGEPMVQAGDAQP
jgi:hypothetical protein